MRETRRRGDTAVAISNISTASTAVKIAGPEDSMMNSAANEAPLFAAGQCASPKDLTMTGAANEAPVSAAGQCASTEDPTTNWTADEAPVLAAAAQSHFVSQDQSNLNAPQRVISNSKRLLLGGKAFEINQR